MKMFKQFIKEDGAGGCTGGGSIASVVMPLGGTKQLIKRKGIKKPAVIGIKNLFHSLREQDEMGGGDTSLPTSTSFDSAGVMSKLKSLENKEKTVNNDTVSFGLEDDQGNTIKVTVRADQSADFERALNSLLTDDDNDMEIPEILYDLKSNFDILDVAWPEIAEDEEEDQQLNLPGQDTEGGDDNLNLDGDDDGEMGNDLGDELDGGIGSDSGEDEEKTLLKQVIDMMRADADARKAEARAKEAEARAKEADAAVHQAMAKVKQEEQILDMESYQKSKKDKDRESKRLAQLAKWKTELDDDDSGNDIEMGTQHQPEMGEENEEAFLSPARTKKSQSNPKELAVRTRVKPKDIANYILSKVKQ